MKLTKRQLRRIIREEKKALTESFNSMSSRSRSLANAAKRQFAKDYPDVQVGIDGREGWITVNGKKAVNMSQASGRPLSIEDIVDQMKQAYLGHDMLSQEVPELTGGRKSSWQVRKERELGESKMKITKRELRRIIREAFATGVGGVSGNIKVGDRVFYRDQRAEGEYDPDKAVLTVTRLYHGGTMAEVLHDDGYTYKGYVVADMTKEI